MAAAAALSAALIGESFSGHARADIQKVEGARRDEQDAVTQVGSCSDIILQKEGTVCEL